MLKKLIFDFQKSPLAFASEKNIIQGYLETDIRTKDVEQSLLIIKPDAAIKKTPDQETLSGVIFHTLIQLCITFGLELPLIATIDMPRYPEAEQFLNTHYQEHYQDFTSSNGTKKTWFPALIKFMKGHEPGMSGLPQFFVIQGPVGRTIAFLREFGLYEFRGALQYTYNYYNQTHRDSLGFTDPAPAFTSYIDPQHNLLHISANPREAAHEVANLLDHLSKTTGMELRHYFDKN